jgi:hypothetical protein
MSRLPAFTKDSIVVLVPPENVDIFSSGAAFLFFEEGAFF